MLREMMKIVCENSKKHVRKNKHKFGGAKACTAVQVRQYFLNPKTENEVFG